MSDTQSFLDGVEQSGPSLVEEVSDQILIETTRSAIKHHCRPDHPDWIVSHAFILEGLTTQEIVDEYGIEEDVVTAIKKRMREKLKKDPDWLRASPAIIEASARKEEKARQRVSSNSDKKSNME